MFQKALRKISSGSHTLDLSHRRGLLPEAVDTGLYAGASYGFGYVHGKYREKAEVRGIPANLFAGILGKGVALIGHMFGYGGPTLLGNNAIGHLNTVANAGIGSYMFSHGVSRGTADSGRKVVIFEPGVPVPAGLPAPTTVVGEIPPAPAGGRSFLSRNEIMNLARQR